MKRSRIRRIGFAALALGAATMLLLVLAVATTPGTRLVLSLAAALSGGTFAYEGASGRLVDRVTLAGLEVETPGITARAENVDLAWRPARLFRRELAIRRVAARGLALAIDDDTAADEEADDAPSELALPELPVAIRIERAALDGVEIVFDGRTITIDRIGAGFEWDRDHIALSALEVEAGPHALAAAGSSATTAAGELDASVDYHGEVAGYDTEAKIGAAGVTDLIELSLSLNSATDVELSATLDLRGAAPRIGLKAQHGVVAESLTGLPFTIDAGRLEGVAVLAAGTARVTAAYRADVLSKYGEAGFVLEAAALVPRADDSEPITADAQWQIDAARLPAPLAGRAEGSYANDRLTVIHGTGLPYATDALLDIDFGSDDPRIAGEVTLATAAPFTPFEIADEQVTVTGGTVTADGPLSALPVTVRLELDVARTGPAALAGEAVVSASDARLERIAVEALNGTLEASGRLGWEPDFTGRLTVTAETLDLSLLTPELEAEVGFDAAVELATGAEGLTAAVQASGLRGAWRGRPLDGHADVRYRPGRVRLTDFGLGVAENRIAGNADIGEQLAGRITLDLPELAALDPALAGTLRGSGEIAGTPEQPALTLELTGEALEFGDAALTSLSADIDLDTARKAGRSRIDITGEALRFGDRGWDGLRIAGTGNREAHRVAITLTGAENALTAELSGGLDAAHAWSGELAALTLTKTPLGDWTLGRPAALRVSDTRQVTSEPLCLLQGEARACVALTDFAERQGRLTVELDGLPLALAQSWLPSNVALDGGLDGRADLAYRDDGILIGDAALAIAAGGIVSRTADSETRVPLENAVADIQLTADAFTGRADATIPGWLDLEANGSVGRRGERALDIDFNLDATDISWVVGIVPELAGSRGRVVLSADIGGTVPRPLVEARLATDEAQIAVPLIGMAISDVALAATTDPDRRVEVTGNVTSAAGGSLTLSGGYDALADENWPLTANITGERFALTRLPEADIDIAPTLRLRAGDEGRVDVQGTVVVPMLRFELTEVPASTVSVSEDQILLEPDGTPMAGEDGDAAATLLGNLSADIEIVLGDEVDVSGLGLSTSLRGGLTLTREPARDTGSFARAAGKVTMSGGRFDAYGQDLEIESGAFLFGGPLENPALDVRAVRPDIPVTAGVLITGTANNPEIGLFSNPYLDDANILSYILTGEPLTGLSGGEGSLIADAAQSFGLEQAALITNEMRELFQLDEFGLTAGDGGLESTALVAGKKLTPRLSLRTQLDLFDQFWSFFLRYDLTSRWAVEGESGRRQGADLIYSVDKERLSDLLWPFGD